MRKIRLISALLTIATCLVLLATGFATWYPLNPDSRQRILNGDWLSYPVIKSNEYVSMDSETGIKTSFAAFYNYKEGVGTQTSVAQGAFANLNSTGLGFIDQGSDNKPDQTTSVVMTYDVKDSLEDMTVEVRIVFGESNTDTASSKLFFATAVPTLTITGASYDAENSKLQEDGSILIYLSNVTEDQITITMALAIANNAVFDSALLEGDNSLMRKHRFFVDTIVKGNLD